MISKPDQNGWRRVWVYDPAAKRKRYVGRRKKLHGPDSAVDLEREKYAEFHGVPVDQAPWTCRDYADRWLAVKHGQGTRRPAATTKQQNASALGFSKVGPDEYGEPYRAGSFLDQFGHLVLDRGVTRERALDWCRDHQGEAKAIAAMFNDAVDDGRIQGQSADPATNPFGNRRLRNKRGRRDIEPFTEGEITRLAQLAEIAWRGPYGRVVAGWITFLAWTGCRPGEACTRTWNDVDLERGLLTVPRIKGDKQTDVVVLPPAAVAALGAMPPQHAREQSDSRRLFLTAQGRPYTIGSYGYYWSPVRAAFVAQLDPTRLGTLTAVKGSLDVYALRHFCGSIMADRGANEFEISAQLGNSPQVCRSTYVHLYRDRVNERNAAFLSDNVRSLNEHRKASGGHNKAPEDAS